MKNLILIGAGGHAKSCIDVIESTKQYNILGLIDLKEKIGSNILGYKIIDCDDNIKNYISNENYFLITLGQIQSPFKRIELFNILKKLNANIATVISPHAYVSKYSEIGEGTIVMHGAEINAAVKIGCNCIINSKALIEHDSIVEDNCHISTGAILNGNVTVKQNSFVGSSATIVQGVIVKENSFLKAGSLIIQNGDKIQIKRRKNYGNY